MAEDSYRALDFNTSCSLNVPVGIQQKPNLYPWLQNHKIVSPNQERENNYPKIKQSPDIARPNRIVTWAHYDAS